MRKPSGQTLFLGAVVVGSCLLVGYLVFDSRGQAGHFAKTTSALTLADIPFDGSRAYECMKRLCALGPRPSGSAAMQAQQKLLVEHFRALGGTVTLQPFRARHPITGEAVSMANLIVQWHPERRERILMAAHYDTRPFPDRDPFHPQGTFVGANDGASGVAVLMELGRHMPHLAGRRGVDFVLLDAEELVFQDRDPYCLGAEYFAREYVVNPPSYRYRWGVLLDMVGDADLQLAQERNSMSWRDTRPLVESIWKTAQRLGVSEFESRKGWQIEDDHVKLRNIGKIPTCDIIDFDYPHWHTEADRPENCSALSLAKVGYVVNEWLKTAVNEQ